MAALLCCYFLRPGLSLMTIERRFGKRIKSLKVFMFPQLSRNQEVAAPPPSVFYSGTISSKFYRIEKLLQKSRRRYRSLLSVHWLLK